MLTSSAKQKGRRLQQKVAKMILEAWPSLAPRDVQSTSMGAGGVDIKMSSAAHAVFPYSVECKNMERNKALVDMYSQAVSNTEADSEPLLVLSCNNAPMLAVVSMQHLIDLRKR